MGWLKRPEEGVSYTDSVSDYTCPRQLCGAIQIPNPLDLSTVRLVASHEGCPRPDSFKRGGSSTKERHHISWDYRLNRMSEYNLITVQNLWKFRYFFNSVEVIRGNQMIGQFPIIYCCLFPYFFKKMKLLPSALHIKYCKQFGITFSDWSIPLSILLPSLTYFLSYDNKHFLVS